MRPITTDQSHQVMSVLTTNAAWKEIDFDAIGLQDMAVRNPKKTGRHFTDFLKNGCRLIDYKRIAIDCSQIFDRTKFAGEDWAVWRGPINGNGLSGEEDIDQRSLALPVIQVSKLILANCGKKDEKDITGTGEEMLRRLRIEQPETIRLGGNAFLGLWNDYKANKEISVLELLHRLKELLASFS